MVKELHIHTIDTHTAGEATRIVASGLPILRGTTLLERRLDLEKRFDHLRRFLTFEPRGHAAMFGAFALPPGNPEADVGVVFFKTLGYVEMCGHGTIGVVTALIETGMVEKREPETTLVLETTAGLIPVRARVVNGLVQDVTFRNVPAFALVRDLSINVQDAGMLSVDVAYGGNWFAILPAKDLGLSLTMTDLPRLRRFGVLIRKATNERLASAEGLQDMAGKIDHALFTGPPRGPKAHARNVVCSGEERFDRSPCGTGTSARMACLYADGILEIGEEFVHECVVDECFRGRLLSETTVDGRPAAIPEITGSAYITGFQDFVLDSRDPLGWGFCTDAEAQG